MQIEGVKEQAAVRLECWVTQTFASQIDEVAARERLRRGPCMKKLCKLAFANPECVPADLDDDGRGKPARLSVYVEQSLLDQAYEYRVLHRLVTNRDFFLDALRRGLAAYWQTSTTVPGKTAAPQAVDLSALMGAD